MVGKSWSWETQGEEAWQNSWGKFEAILLNYGRQNLVRGGHSKDARHLAICNSWAAQTFRKLFLILHWNIFFLHSPSFASVQFLKSLQTRSFLSSTGELLLNWGNTGVYSCDTTFVLSIFVLSIFNNPLQFPFTLQVVSYNASWVRDTPSMNVLFKYNSNMNKVESIPSDVVWSVQNTVGFV